VTGGIANLAVSSEVRDVTPKTNRSRRTVSLDVAVVAELRRHRARQNEERLVAGSAWQGGGYVFARWRFSAAYIRRRSQIS
jgi:hypothetical protein